MRRDLTIVLFLAIVAGVLAVPPGQFTVLAVTLIAVVLCSLIGLKAAQAMELRIAPPFSIRDALTAIATGVIAATIVVAPLYFFAHTASMQTRWRQEVATPVWRRILISFDSAILEELVFRLFILSAVAWLLGRLVRRVRRDRALVAANVVAALVFAAVHLPRWLALGAPPLLVATIVLVNLFAGLVLGWMYTHRSLALGVLTHFAADITAHVIAPGVMLAIT